MKTRLLALVAGLAALMSLSSCIETHQTLNLKKDGSGTLVEETMMGAQMVAMMQLGAGQPGAPDPIAEMEDEQQYKDKAAGYGEGVEFEKLEKVEKNGGKGVKVTYKFKDVNKVRFEPGSGLDNMGPGAGDGVKEVKKEVQPLTFVYADGKLTITFPDPPKDAKAEEIPDVPAGEDLDPQAAQMMQMFKDMKICAKVVVEPGIKTTNATYREGDTITLMEVNFGEILQNPDGAKVLQKLDMADRKAMEEALKDVKGVKMETKKTVDVTVK